MDYLAEAGDLFFDSNVVTVQNEDKDKSGGWLSWCWNALVPNQDNPADKLDATLSVGSSSVQKQTSSSECDALLSYVAGTASSSLARRSTKRYPNGDRFTGLVDVVTGEPIHGQKVYRASGGLYEGPFIKGKRHGKRATYRAANGTTFTGTYENDQPVKGTVATDKFTYYGGLMNKTATENSFTFHSDNATIIWTNGDMYEGEFRNGFYHGCGTENTSQYKYKGEYKDGKRHGTGTLIVPVENIYGDYFHGGEWTYDYTGGWFNNMMDGRGVEKLVRVSKGETFSSCFEGTFNQNRRNGPGTLTLFDGSVLEGTWRWGEPEVTVGDDVWYKKRPKWRITFPNGDVYNGDCCAIPNEELEQSEVDKSCFKYLWHKGEPNIVPHGNGTMFYANTNDLYCGEFHMGKRQGHGVYIVQETGEEYDGLWGDDEPETYMDDDGVFTTLKLYSPVCENESETDDSSSSSLNSSEYASDKHVEEPLYSLEDTIAVAKFSYAEDKFKAKKKDDDYMNILFSDSESVDSIVDSSQDDVDEHEDKFPCPSPLTEENVRAKLLENLDIQCDKDTAHTSTRQYKNTRQFKTIKREDKKTCAITNTFTRQFKKTDDGSWTPSTSSSTCSTGSNDEKEFTIDESINLKLRIDSLKRERNRDLNQLASSKPSGKAVFTLWTRLES